MTDKYLMLLNRYAGLFPEQPISRAYMVILFAVDTSLYFKIIDQRPDINLYVHPHRIMQFIDYVGGVWDEQGI